MKLNPLGRTGLFVSELCLGAMTFGGKGYWEAIGKLGTGSKALDMHLDFVSKQQDTLEGAIGNLVDADMAREAARFQALQVRQQLAVQAMQIANRQPSLLLQLFNFR